MRKLLFVCGFPSGGTDLTRTVLNAHPDIHLNGEMPFLKNIPKLGCHQDTSFTQLSEVKAFQHGLKKLDAYHAIKNIEHDFSEALKAQGRLSLEDVLYSCFSRNQSPIWGNKTPQNTENIGRLAQLFPQAYFLIVTRDVRDVCLSWQKKWGKDMLGCASKWAKRMDQGWQATQRLPANHYLYLRFEDLLADTESCCRQVCRWLEIPFAAEMLEHHKYVTEKTDGKINYGQEIKKENAYKWKDKISPNVITRIEEIAFDTLCLLGYRAEYAQAKKALSVWEGWQSYRNDALAMLTVGNQASRRNTLNTRLKTLVFEFRKRQLR
ncbi:MAG TPA: sulfotransferase [Anaerolineae bacterium]|nr:sulfotransferase [Anaerolineae bacterium]HMR63830.1 sulfotransferase [Anaerolineae bacterium]